ncbi:MAG TPA: hypothetical protein VF590_21130, partial [Isosphaeraceae bacterium]
GASGDRLVRLWNPENGTIQRTLSGPSDYAFGVATSADGARVAAGGADSVLFVWRDNGQILRKIGPPAPSAPGAGAAAGP